MCSDKVPLSPWFLLLLPCVLCAGWGFKDATTCKEIKSVNTPNVNTTVDAVSCVNVVSSTVNLAGINA